MSSLLNACQAALDLKSILFHFQPWHRTTLHWIGLTAGGLDTFVYVVHSGAKFFPEKTNNMKGYPVNVATFLHVPSTIKHKNTPGNASEKDGEFYFSGLEVEIVKSLGEVMNFEPVIYEVPGRWGHRRLNGSYSGLFGELMVGRAQLGLGTLQHTLYTLELVDLSRPFMSICLTFLTPQSSTDNSWTALLMPFMVTIDTIQELVTSPVQCAGWGEPEKLFFTTSFDPDIHKIGTKFQTVEDVDNAVSRVAGGTLAYYENKYFLLDSVVQYNNKSNSVGGRNKQFKLHVMADCIISMPVSIGLEKNSPLKPLVDKFIQRVVEAGLVNKWLSDVTADSRRRHDAYKTVQVKALMDISKFSGALVALGVGYTFCILALVGELLYWHLVIKRDPLFDKYSMQQFYFCKKLKS